MMNSVIDLKGEKGVYISSVKQAEDSENKESSEDKGDSKESEAPENA